MSGIIGRTGMSAFNSAQASTPAPAAAAPASSAKKGDPDASLIGGTRSAGSTRSGGGLLDPSFGREARRILG